jgi:hypothetical protein
MSTDKPVTTPLRSVLDWQKRAKWHRDQEEIEADNKNYSSAGIHQKMANDIEEWLEQQGWKND